MYLYCYYTEASINNGYSIKMILNSKNIYINMNNDNCLINQNDKYKSFKKQSCSHKILL